jgi:energy-coupling factor transporter ATP-binding protein EcfA2
VSWLYIALLAAAIAVVAAAEWPRLEGRVGPRVTGEARRRRQRERRKASMRVVQNPDQDDFAASVERDLANLPTIEDSDRRR